MILVPHYSSSSVLTSIVSSMLVSSVLISFVLSSVRIRLHDSLLNWSKAIYPIRLFVSVACSSDAKLDISGSEGLTHSVIRYFMRIVWAALEWELCIWVGFFGYSYTIFFFNICSTRLISYARKLLVIGDSCEILDSPSFDGPLVYESTLLMLLSLLLTL